jgi:hypothetical protein
MSPDDIRFTVNHAETSICIGHKRRPGSRMKPAKDAFVFSAMACSDGAPDPTGGAALFESRRRQRLLDSRPLSNPPTTAPPT